MCPLPLAQSGVVFSVKCIRPNPYSKTKPRMCVVLQTNPIMLMKREVRLIIQIKIYHDCFTNACIINWFIYIHEAHFTQIQIPVNHILACHHQLFRISENIIRICIQKNRISSSHFPQHNSISFCVVCLINRIVLKEYTTI